MKKLLLILCIPLIILGGCFLDNNVIDIVSYTAKTEFTYGETFSVGSLSVKIKYQDNTLKSISLLSLKDNGDRTKSNDDIIIDYSKYNPNEIGTYPIIITYKANTQIKKTYYVTVKAKDIQNVYNIQNFECTYDAKSHTIDLSILPEDAIINFKENSDSSGYSKVTCPTYINAGTYKIYYKITRYGYSDFEGVAEVKINKKDLLIQINDIDLLYNQEFYTNSCTFESSGYEGLDNDLLFYDRITYSTTYSKGSPCGEYEITASGFVSNNYNIIVKNGTLKVSKMQNTLIITFPSNITYGESITNKATVETNISGGNINYYYSLADENKFSTIEPKNVGNYVVRCVSQETENYAAATIERNISIRKANLRITANNETIEYGNAFDLSNCNCSMLGQKYSDTISDLGGEPVYTTNYEQGNNVGNYSIMLTGYTSDNYEITFINGVLEVKQTDNNLQVKFYTDTTDNNIAYNGEILNCEILSNPSNVELKYYYKNELDNTFVEGLPKNAGKYNIKITQDESLNYNEFEHIYNIQISCRIAELSWTPLNFIYDGSEHCPEAICQNVCLNDVVNTLVRVNTECINAGNYIAECYSLSNSNYALPDNNTYAFDVNKQEVAIPVVESKVYNGGLQCADVNDNNYYTVTKNEYRQEVYDAGYDVEFTLRDANNYCWPNTTSNICVVKFYITQAQNTVIKFEIPNWGYDHTGKNHSTPKIQATYYNYYSITWWEEGVEERADTITYWYRNGKENVWPTLVGNYNARLEINNSTNYLGVRSEVVTFSIEKVDAPYTIIDIINMEYNNNITYETIKNNLPSDYMGAWTLIDENKEPLNSSTLYLIPVTDKGINAFYVKFTPKSIYTDGYNEVYTYIYFNLTDKTLLSDSIISSIEIDDINKSAADTDLSVTLGYTLPTGADIYYSAYQNGEYVEINSETIIMTATENNIGKHVAWLKIVIEGYEAYYTHCIINITE